MLPCKCLKGAMWLPHRLPCGGHSGDDKSMRMNAWLL